MWIGAVGGFVLMADVQVSSSNIFLTRGFGRDVTLTK